MTLNDHQPTKTEQEPPNTALSIHIKEEYSKLKCELDYIHRDNLNLKLLPIQLDKFSQVEDKTFDLLGTEPIESKEEFTYCFKCNFCVKNVL
ncbi:unnamed protein product [Diabrotica balteata]|uniref:Uncharacterized protein n=1 Tax=Diabrotica balteata TaxID=107213 RepID=A0A9N9T727_DIABA|nr:unnamed protein product [Diabrotica balteata]